MIGVRLGRYYEKNGVYGQIVALSVEQEQRGQHIGSSLVPVLLPAPAASWLGPLLATGRWLFPPPGLPAPPQPIASG